jgi:thymidylate synthase
MVETASVAWLNMLTKIMNNGVITHPRGFTCKEILGNLTLFDMTFPVTLVASRKLGFRFMCAEAAWIMSGDNRVATIQPYSKEINRYSDDGLFFYGAYGPRIIDQVSYITKTLINDNDSRQAVLTIWRENPPPTKDVPCTISLQFQLRNYRLNCFLCMRSSDAWLGVPYDVFNFSMLTGYICLLLRKQSDIHVNPGTLYFYAGNQHLYDTSFDLVKNIKTDILPFINSMFLPLTQFKEPQDLIDHLWKLANKDFDGTTSSFLTNDLRGYYAKTKQG